MITLTASEVDSIHAAFIYDMKEFTEEDIHRAIRVGAEYQLEDILRQIKAGLEAEPTKPYTILSEIVERAIKSDASPAKK